VSNDRAGCPRCGRNRGARSLPFFHRRETRSNGNSHEVSIGPSIVWLAIAVLLLLAGAGPFVLIQFLLKLL